MSQTRLEVRPLPSASPAGAGSLQHWRWPNPDNLAEVAKTYMALACVQQQLTGLSRAEFRLRWRVWDRHSTLDLLLADPGLTPQQLLGCPDAEAFVRLRQQQVEHWQTRLDTDLSHWVQLLAQYRLPAAEPGQLIRQLEQLERDEVQHHLQRLASSDTYRRLIFPPATEDPHAPSQ